jgi:hypothetical protein
MSAILNCPECGKAFAQTSPLKKYCNIRCTDKAAHKAARNRARRGPTHKEIHQIAEVKQDERRWAQAAADLRAEDAAKALEDVFGFKSDKITITVPDTGYDEDEAKAEDKNLKQLKEI